MPVVDERRGDQHEVAGDVRRRTGANRAMKPSVSTKPGDEGQQRHGGTRPEGVSCHRSASYGGFHGESHLPVDAPDVRPPTCAATCPYPSALACVRCSARYPVDHYAQDCPACRARGRAGQSHRRLRFCSRYRNGPRRHPPRPRLDVALGRLPARLRRRGGDPGRGQHAAAARAVARPRRRLDQGRIAQPDLVVQGPAGLAARSPWRRRFGAKVIASSSSGNAGASAAAYAAKAGTAVRGLHLHGLGRAAGHCRCAPTAPWW